MLSGQTFLVTGATGRLGCDLTARLEELGASVLPIVLKGYPAHPKLVDWTAKTPPLQVDDELALHELPPPDYAINLHWRVDRTRPYTEQIVNELDCNINRVAFLWQWLKERSVRRFVNCSTIKVYSHLNASPVSAESEPHPVSPYGISKLSAEKFFSAFFTDSPTAVTHLRLSSVFSFGEHPTQLMSQLAASAFDGTRIRLTAGNRIALMYIDEAVDVIINAALVGRSERYLVATTGRLVGEVAGLFERISGRKLNAECVDLPRGVGDPDLISDLDNLRADWVRVTPLEEAIACIIDRRARAAAR